MAEQGVPLSVALDLEHERGDATPFTSESVRLARDLVVDLVKETPALRVVDVSPAIVKEVAGALRTGAGEIFVNAWNKRDEIRKYADQERYGPPSTHSVWLYDHDVEQTITPTVQVRLDGVDIGDPIAFVVAAKLTIRGARVDIRDGRVMSFGLAGVAVSATVSARLPAGKVKLLEFPEREWQLPAEIPLGKGIPIPPPS
jgi:hypothetical protein